MLVVYKAEKPSVCPSVCRHFLVRSIFQSGMHGSMSDLLEVIAVSSGVTKFIFKSLVFRQESMIDTRVELNNHNPMDDC